MTQDEHESQRNDPGRNNKRMVGETDVNEKIVETARKRSLKILNLSDLDQGQ